MSLLYLRFSKYHSFLCSKILFRFHILKPTPIDISYFLQFKRENSTMWNKQSMYIEYRADYYIEDTIRGCIDI